MFNAILTVVLVMMCIAMLICSIRIFIGPTVSDRIAALDMLGLLLIGFLGVLMCLQRTVVYTEIILVVGILSFAGTVALAIFVERGFLFERD